MIPLYARRAAELFVVRKRGPGEDAKDTCGQERMKSCSKAMNMERSSQEIKIWP